MSRRPSSTTLLALAFLGFVSLGLPDGLLGVAAPSIRASFAVAPEEFGALLVAFAAGYLSSSFASGAILARIGVGTLLALSCLLTAASLAMYAAAPWWWWMVAGGSLSGLGAGAIDSGINTYAATRHSPRTVNWLHACYGVGAMSGPVLMTSVLAAGRSWRFGYALVGAAQLALAAAFAATRTFWPSAAAPDDDAGSEASADAGDAALPARVRQTLARPVVWLGIAIFLVYTGLEATVAVWGFSFLTQARGIALTTAGWWLSGFWLGLTAGRVAFGWVGGRGGAPLGRPRQRGVLPRRPRVRARDGAGLPVAHRDDAGARGRRTRGERGRVPDRGGGGRRVVRPVAGRRRGRAGRHRVGCARPRDRGHRAPRAAGGPPSRRRRSPPARASLGCGDLPAVDVIDRVAAPISPPPPDRGPSSRDRRAPRAELARRPAG